MEVWVARVSIGSERQLVSMETNTHIAQPTFSAQNSHEEIIFSTSDEGKQKQQI